MQFYSLHHCVLLFLILTFTTAPVSALDVCPTRVKLHQPVTLPCKHRCSGLLKWSLLSNRDVVQAQCDQTSCRSEPGFSISHDQYLRGDFSLTITAADYSQRKVYGCECGDTDYAYVRLVIETVFSAVQMKFHEDLKLHVSVPEPVEVIYKSSGSADEVICRVNNLSLQCKDEYRDRTSLTYPEITLRHVEPRDSGSYTIRDTENEQDIQIYAVSVEDKPLWELYGVPVWGIVLIVLSLLICAAVGMYFLWKHLMRKQFNRRLLRVVQFVQQAEEGKQEISEVEKKIDDLEDTYNELDEQYLNSEHIENVKRFCDVKRRQLNWCSLQHDEHRVTEKRELNRRLVLVDQLVQRYKGGTEEKIIEVKKKINQLEQLYRNTEYYKQVTVLCDVKRKQLDTGGPQQLATLLKEMIDVEQCVHEAIEGVKEKISEAEEKIYQLELHMTSEDFVKVSEFCMYMRAELFWSTLHNDKDSGEAGGGDDEFTEDQRWSKERAEDTELHRGGRDEETSDED